MSLQSKHQDLVDRLQYTFITADYDEIDTLIAGIRKKVNYEDLCTEFFQGCRIDSQGSLIHNGFFAEAARCTTLLYAMYELLGTAPDTFLLKHRVSRVTILRGEMEGSFRLPEGLFSLPQLEVLIIRDMGIQSIPEDISKMNNLKILDLAGNRLTSIDNSILKLYRLSALNLSFNLIVTLPPNIERLKSLRLLSLKGNKIMALPEKWSRMQYLRTLDLSMNEIDSIPDALQTLNSLEELNLAYNNLAAHTEALWEKRIRNGEHREETQGMLELGQ